MKSAGQCQVSLVHDVTQPVEIPIESQIVERSQCDRAVQVGINNPSGQFEKGLQCFPGGMGVRSGEQRIACPEDEIGQSDIEKRHKLIFAIIKQEHVTELFLKVEQRPLYLTLLCRIASCFSIFIVGLMIRFCDLLSPPLNVPTAMIQDLDVLAIQKQIFTDDTRVRRNQVVAEIHASDDLTAIEKSVRAWRSRS